MENTRLIPLSQGRHAIVDATDFDWLNQWKWHAHWKAPRKCYVAIRSERVDSKWQMVLMHRLILGLEYGDPRFGDHINGETLDNRRSNLRIATCAENNRNVRTNRKNTTGFKGVTLHKASGKYLAQISIDGKRKHLGLRATAQEAYDLYRTAATEHHASFARLA